MSKIKDNLEAEKQEKNNQMDQDYWAEKAEEEGGLKVMEAGLRDDIDEYQEEYDNSLERLIEVNRENHADLIALKSAKDKLAKFLEANPKI